MPNVKSILNDIKKLQLYQIDKEIIKSKKIIVQGNVAHSYIKIKDLKNGETVYV